MSQFVSEAVGIAGFVSFRSRVIPVHPKIVHGDAVRLICRVSGVVGVTLGQVFERVGGRGISQEGYSHDTSFLEGEDDNVDVLVLIPQPLRITVFVV